MHDMHLTNMILSKFKINLKLTTRTENNRCREDEGGVYVSESCLPQKQDYPGYMTLLFPTLNIAATCEIHPRLPDNQWKNLHHVIDKHVKLIASIQSITHPFILTPRRLCWCHPKNGAAKAPNVY
jgi:hypothetical protein